MRIPHSVKFSAAAVLSVGFMWGVLQRVDTRALIRCLAEADPGWLVVVLGLFVPQIVCAAIRWQRLLAPTSPISLRTSVELTLAASALNLFLPSKLGDLSKAYFSSRTGSVTLRQGTALVIMERYLDVAALTAWMTAGVILARRWDAAGRLGLAGAVGVFGVVPLAYRLLRTRPFIRDAVPVGGLGVRRGVGWSWGLWGCHLLQFYGMFRAVGAETGPADILRLVPLGIFVGLVPLTLAGVGTRDAAFLVLFAGLEPPARIAAVGLFASFRYLLPGLLGLPFLGQYVAHSPEARPTPML